MKKKYTKAKVEIISMKTEAVCGVDASVDPWKPGEGDPDPVEERDSVTAKAFDGNGINDFSFDPTPSTKA